jgi:multidrug resistance efflux pump
LRSRRKGAVLISVLAAALLSVVFTKVDVPVESTEIAAPDPGIVPLIATATGTIRRIHVRQGSLVSQGDAVVQLESRDLVLKRRMLESKIHQRETSTLSRTELADLYRQLEKCQLELNSRTLVSPVDGQVIWLGSFRPGDILRPGTAVATIVAYKR